MRKSKAIEGAVPQGYERVQTGNFPPNHDFQKEPELQGRVTQIKSVPQKRGKKTEEVKVLYVANADGVITAVWESHAIADGMAQVKPGDDVFIRFNGVQKLKGRKTLKLFDFAIKAKSGKK